MRLLRSLAGKILIPVILMTLLLVSITLIVSTLAFRKAVRESFDKEITMIARDIEHELQNLSDTIVNQLNGIVRDHSFLTAFKAKDREAIFKAIEQYDVPQKGNLFSVIDSETVILVRTDNFQKFGDSAASRPDVKAVFEGKTLPAFYESSQSNPMALRATVAIRDEDGKIIGALSGGYRLSANEWVDGMKEFFGADFTTFVGDMRVATTLKKADGERAVGTPLNNPPLQKILFEDKKSMSGETMVLGKQMKVFYHPLIGLNGETIGIIFSGVPMARMQNAIWNNIYNNLIITGIGMLVFCGLLFMVVRGILGPLQKVTDSANQLVQGHLNVDLDVRTKDELNVLAGAFNRVGEALRQKVEVAHTIAQKNLMTYVPLTSDDDALGIALIEMRQALFEAIKELADHSKKMHSESDTLSDTLQALVAGSTQSSAAIANIDSSIKKLNTQTRDNAKRSGEAASLATQARSGSTNGKERMAEMIQAMGKITQGAAEIKKIIRVIDDIAFQTNLLALNAAVEAARAGVHGKGFAVVAEEVRNLASRSAKAAQETNQLIEEAIGQVDQGSQVAQTTSDSLNTIIEQVEQINDIIGLISKESEQQTQEVDSIAAAISEASIAVESNSQQISDASHSVESIASTAKELDDIARLFKYRDDGKVSPPPESENSFQPRNELVTN